MSRAPWELLDHLEQAIMEAEQDYGAVRVVRTPEYARVYPDRLHRNKPDDEAEEAHDERAPR